MTKFWIRLPVPALLFATAVVASAQPAPGALPTDPLDAAANVPRATYRSPLAEYRRHSEPAVTSWKEANERVNRIGGWRTYAREANQPDSPVIGPPPRGASAPTNSPPDRPSSTPSGHGGHQGHDKN